MTYTSVDTSVKNGGISGFSLFQGEPNMQVLSQTATRGMEQPQEAYCSVAGVFNSLLARIIE